MNLKNTLTIALLSTCLALGNAPTAFGTSLYISDQIYVPVRKGKGKQYSILHRGLQTGTRVTLIEREEDWTKIETQGGIVGWVPNQFLESSPPAKMQLETANKKIEKLNNQLSVLTQEKETLSRELQETKDALNSTQQQAKQTTKELDSLKIISASAVQSHQQAQKLTEDMQLLQTKYDVINSI